MRLENLEVSDVSVPDYAVLTFAVCTVDESACGWGGWMLEGAMVVSSEKSGILRNGDNPLPSATLQICPNCGGETFRTDTAHVYDLAGPAGLRLDRDLAHLPMKVVDQETGEEVTKEKEDAAE